MPTQNLGGDEKGKDRRKREEERWVMNKGNKRKRNRETKLCRTICPHRVLDKKTKIEDLRVRFQERFSTNINT